MFYALLDLIVCSACHGELVLLCPREQPATTTMRLPAPRRMGAPGAPVGPLPAAPANTRLWQLLAPRAGQPAPAGRDRDVALVEGLLVCPRCEQWYPLRDGLPELLPAHLRPWDEERQWLAARQPDFVSAGLEEVFQALLAHAPAAAGSDPGAHYKKSEMAITQRNLRQDFFGPARVAPFIPMQPGFSLDELARYVTTVSRLGCGMHGTVLDIGVGYAWTTEWLVRLGYQAIGVDITRDYILAGYPRLGPYVPHLVVADTENLPLRPECVDAVLSFDAFHHLPDRPRAMRELARVMRPGAQLVLVEPGKLHESDPASIAVMQQHGILERGFDRADLAGYISGTSLGHITHHRSDTHPHDVFVVRQAGVFQPDSRSPRTLVAGIALKSQAIRLPVGQRASLAVTMTNTGDTTWLHATADGQGEVQLGANLYDAAHNLLQDDYVRVRLPRSLKPGQRLQVACALPALSRPGQYWVELDLVDNGLIWFKDLGSRPVQIALEVWAPAAEVVAPDAPLVATAAAGETAVELAFDPAYLAPRRGGGRTRLPTLQVPRIVWRVLRDEGPGPLLRKSLHYLRVR